jgi:hypothetical protein
MNALISFIPFISPVNFFQTWWYLLVIPLAFGVSVIYKAIRLPRMDAYWLQVWLMTGQIVLVMALLAIGIAVFIQLVVPII